MKCATSCGKTRKSETLKKNMLQQADEVEATTSKKRLTISMCRFMLTLKFTANTNKKRHLFILPHVPQSKMTIPDKKQRNNHEKCYFV